MSNGQECPSHQDLDDSLQPIIEFESQKLSPMEFLQRWGFFILFHARSVTSTVTSDILLQSLLMLPLQLFDTLMAEILSLSVSNPYSLYRAPKHPPIEVPTCE